MNKILLKNLATIFTFDNKDRILESQDILIEDERIYCIKKNIEVQENCTVINCEGLIAMPGFVNTHHHLYQTLFRGIKEVQEKPLFPWLVGLYEFWKHIDEEAVYYGAMVGFSELLRTGCTTTTDHHYVFPQGSSKFLIDEQIKAAKNIGIRFHATRGSMSRGKKDGGLPPNEVVQNEEEIIIDSERVIKKYHDKSRFAMTRIALAPCSPFSVSKKAMSDARNLADKYGVMLHTHLAETFDEEDFCKEVYGTRPAELMEEVGWIGKDVWFAHGIHLNDEDINRLKGAGIAHCPSSNMKLSSGICRTTELVKMGVPISIAVDGSASNDGSNMWEEIRRAYLLNHLKYANDGLNAYDILKIATRGGAEVIGRDDIGRLEENMAADIILLNLNDVAYSGCHDVASAIVNCGNTSMVEKTILNGKVVVNRGIICTVNVEDIIMNANKISREIVMKERIKNIN